MREPERCSCGKGSPTGETGRCLRCEEADYWGPEQSLPDKEECDQCGVETPADGARLCLACEEGLFLSAEEAEQRLVSALRLERALARARRAEGEE